jgi:hypothetical protein
LLRCANSSLRRKTEKASRRKSEANSGYAAKLKRQAAAKAKPTAAYAAKLKRQAAAKAKPTAAYAAHLSNFFCKKQGIGCISNYFSVALHRGLLG